MYSSRIHKLIFPVIRSTSRSNVGEQRANESRCAHRQGWRSIVTGKIAFSRANRVCRGNRACGRRVWTDRGAEGGRVTRVSLAGKGGGYPLIHGGLMRGERGDLVRKTSKGGGTRFPADHWG